MKGYKTMQFFHAKMCAIYEVQGIRFIIYMYAYFYKMHNVLGVHVN